MTWIDLCLSNIILAVFCEKKKKGGGWVLQNPANQKTKIISFLFVHFAEKSVWEFVLGSQ